MFGQRRICMRIAISFLFGAGLSALSLMAQTGTDPKLLQNAYANWKEVPYVETAPEPLLTDQEKARGFLLFSRPITEIVYPNTRPLAEERVEELSAFATPGEFEPFNFAIYPLKNISRLTVSASPFKSSEGEIDSSAIDVRLLRCYDIRYPHYNSKTFRRVPELLEKVADNSFPNGECQRYWLTVKVPAGAKPGIYKGSVSLTGENIPAVNIPLNLRVLPFTLKKDPAKHFAVFSTNFTERKEVFNSLSKEITASPERINEIAINDYRAMQDYGIDTPLEYSGIRYDARGDKLFLQPALLMDYLNKSGLLQSPYVIMGTDNATKQLLQKYNIKYADHFVLDKTPPPEFFEKYAELIKKLEVERKANGWPVFVYHVLDEVASGSSEFGSKLYKTIKDLGVPTFTTKDPKSFDAPAYFPFVDYWAAQTFSVPYEEVIKDKQHHYWCYPNHNACEVRIPEVMCKGGRMTYGYGFWRSGYEGLAPWHWRWGRKNPLDYRDGDASDCGNQLAPDGTIMPAVYWECFREGYDDMRYLYTLESAIAERENVKDEECGKAVAAGKLIIQDTWNAIDPQLKYLRGGMWRSEDFNNRRWEIAMAIERLLKFPPADSSPIPVKSSKEKVKTDPVLEKSLTEGNIESFNLGGENYSGWKNITGEGKTEVAADKSRNDKKSLKWTVKIDYASDEGEKGNRIGWPRIRLGFPKGALDMTKYDYLSFWYYIESKRDEVADDFTPLHLSVGSHVAGSPFDRNNIINAADERVWNHVLVPVKEMMIGSSADSWKNISFLQLWLREAEYKDGTNLVFYFNDIRFIKFKAPQIVGIDAPGIALLPAAKLIVSCILGGDSTLAPGDYKVIVSLTDGKETYAAAAFDPTGFRTVGIDLSRVTAAGDYTLQMQLVDAKKKIISEKSQTIRFLEGPIPGRRR